MNRCLDDAPLAKTSGRSGYRAARMVGADGLATLLLSNLVILTSAGISLAWVLRAVYRTARNTPPLPAAADTALVLGFRLQNRAVSPEFAGRLLRASALYQRRRIGRILVLGGRTGRETDLSEGGQGRRFLIGCGVPAARILVEEDSVHTLENLRNARAKLGETIAKSPVILVTSRYHLARSLAMAAGFGLKPVPCPAEDRLSHAPGTLLRLIREAWFLHWYHVGSAWSRWTGNARSLARIS